MSKFGIARLDLMAGHAHHYTVTEEMENGILVEVDYKTGEIAPTKDIKVDQLLLASVANTYDSADESDFINTPDGMKARAYHFTKGDIFSTTQFTGKALDAIKKGDFAHATVGGKFTIANTEEATAAQGFRVVETTSLNGQEAVVLKVTKA